MNKQPVKRYSVAFKKQVVREYEAGASGYSLCRKYGIGGVATIKSWVDKYGKEGYRAGVVQIQSVEDQEEFQAMKERIRQLESVLAQSVIENQMLKTTLEVASESLEMDLKKVFGKRL